MSTLSLVTIGPSHYCEKARWALERAGVDYVEEAHLPMLHWAHVYPKTKTRTVPVLIGPGVRALDSSAIVAFADRELDDADRLLPSEPEARAEALALEARFDAELGPATRRHVYCHLVDAPKAFEAAFGPGLPAFEARLLPVLSPLLRAGLRRAFKVSPRAAERTGAAIRAIFDDVADALGERRFLVGDRFSVADLSFVTLAGPVLLLDRSDAELDAMPSGLRATVDAMRAHPAGVYARRVHDEERRRKVASARGRHPRAGA